ncbi:NAD-dependent epimerase/dehydratase [Catenulispora acidiphila DSM 44928]|uniref:NAD-dependent epimerase/dehydratase n=1 Tax=Catenulispora acidiphila (strain DSM 44928 / JCM 14897 / NBRC 102108 / NRRL B-24433 / ID139908) TaxID=479433 RepID=C7PY92_CATAD|nr:SDR family oxidoreductase [Catenulispora acidiphila]ACU75382.1 NAD-dependent epimerase/dehydratase [Catenulispora acidiphila DSM 44928]
MRITVFGAHGLTGRQLTRQALDAGYDVTAVTRRPAEYPISDDHLNVAPADVYDSEAVDRALDGADVVLSTLGVPFTRKPIDIYSQGTRTIAAAMPRHGIKRLVVISSSATEPHHHADGGFLLNRVLQPLVTRTIGKTTYADMRRMEDLVRTSGLEWTIMRPSGLFDAPDVTAYQLYEDEAPGIFTSRADLAASMLAQVTDTRFLHKAVAVTTSEGAPTLLQMMRREAFKKD